MKYTLIFLALGGSVSCFACIWGRWWHGLHWLSLSFFVLSAGYAGLGSRVYGKRPDGRIPLWSKLVNFPYMLALVSVWRLVCLLSRENATDEVADDLAIGRRLAAGELPGGIVNYVDLVAEIEDPKAARDLPGYVSLPILDADMPSADALRSVVSQLPPGRTYVHCAQGHGRAALFALALLVQRGVVKSFDEGMKLIRSARPGVGLHKGQEAFMRNYLAGDEED